LIPIETVEPFDKETTTETPRTKVTTDIIAADPISSHHDDIHETTRVGLTLVRQATDELALDAKFDVQPQNQKAFLRELTKRAMDCCWVSRSLWVSNR
jgi:organic hydroperoxide reductase OsmC/OhrA